MEIIAMILTLHFNTQLRIVITTGIDVPDWAFLFYVLKAHGYIQLF